MAPSLNLFVLYILVAAVAAQNATGINPLNGLNETFADDRLGWVSSPNGRGTIDIIWSCLVTVFLCTWTSLHLNLPSVKENYWQRFRRKLRWMIQGIMGPEFIVAFATGQKVEAKRSVEMWKKPNGRWKRLKHHPEWTMRHGFYANMGGFILKAPDCPAFPINAKQLHYLVVQGYTPYPSITEKEVWDKSKQDGFQKTLTLFQTGWFLIECIGRAAQRLSMTTLELTTVSFVFCTFASYYQWANKPLDVESPTIIEIETKIAQILIEARSAPDADKPYSHTPLDFIDNQAPSWLTEIQPHLHFRTGPRERPLPRFTNDRFPVIGAGPDAVLLFVVMLAYCCLHFIAWKFSFPTRIEQLLWRTSCIATVATTFIFLACETYQDGHRLGRWDRWYIKLFPHKKRTILRMNTMEKRKREMEFVPKWEFILMSPVTMVYTLARTYIVVEVFSSLRSLPAGAFDSVQWSTYIPHF